MRQRFKRAATHYDKTRQTIDFLTCAIQKAFCDISVVTSGNKLQTKSAIFKCLIQANNERIVYTMDHYNQ